ncbi:PhaM family polyhydroxyalkanoate granule multifunctional regulatory protein [Trinickia sp.]|uniref:PhaM family polyhydroxyalkanoate granule multifunctional regulatory protein n=1 Tax=Trinickia sp. TaxID=2571163 RepID=UPI003F7E4396
MTDTAGDQSPFPGFPGFPPAEMLDKMWDMMRLTPFGAAFPGMQPGTAQGFSSPLTAMSDMMSPLMSVEELDKRITDMRAVEQWLKLNLNMLQSAIQALEVQRATLSTLRAFGAFAQASMTQPSDTSGPASTKAASSSPWGASESRSSEASTAGASGGDGNRAESGADASPAGSAEGGDASAAFDPAGWWNLLQSQFNQLAAFAMTQPGAATDSEAGSKSKPKASGGASGRGAKGASAGRGSAASSATNASNASNAKPAAKRAPARKSGTKPPGGSGGGARDEK